MNEFAAFMVAVGQQADLDRQEAISAARAVLRYFGGQQVYFPTSAYSSSAESRNAELLRGVVADELGDGLAERYTGKFLKAFGGGQLYMPLERSAFRDEIADEIYKRYDGTTETMSDLCREYGTTFVQIYRLYHRALKRRRDNAGPSLFDDQEQ